MSDHDLTSVIEKTVSEAIKRTRRGGGDRLNSLLIVLAAMVILAAIKLMTGDTNKDIKHSIESQVSKVSDSLDELHDSFIGMRRSQETQDKILADHEARLWRMERK